MNYYEYYEAITAIDAGKPIRVSCKRDPRGKHADINTIVPGSLVVRGFGGEWLVKVLIFPTPRAAYLHAARYNVCLPLQFTDAPKLNIITIPLQGRAFEVASRQLHEWVKKYLPHYLGSVAIVSPDIVPRSSKLPEELREFVAHFLPSAVKIGGTAAAG